MKTAVEWFLEELENNDWYWLPESIKNEIINQAKEMEKQQIIDAHLDGQSLVSCKDEYAEQYYNETFKSDEQE
jgi:vacuolar-type H+-ATPase subunit H